VEVSEDAEGVSLALRASGRSDRSVRAAYAVGCDGARSIVRHAIGAELVGSTYEQRWLIVDLGATKETFRETRVACNPARPMITLPGPHGVRRYEFMLHDGESDEEATSPAFVRALLAANGPDADVPVVRRRVYTFHARVADRWATRRIFLAGDAAHLSPPFAGQGMNSGVRDAHNLAWKLAAVVSGRLGPGVLETYERERSPHARALIQFAVNIGRVMMPASALQAFLVQTGFRLTRFVPPVHAFFAQMKYKPKPYYRRGFLAPPAGSLVGRMLPQPRLELRDGRRVQLDDVMGNGFAVVVYGRGAERRAGLVARMDLGVGDASVVAVLPAHFNPVLDPAPGISVGRDVDGRFARLTASGGELVLLVRPDRYVAVAGVAAREEDAEAFAASCRRLAAGSWSAASTRAVLKETASRPVT
jgi:3-(3-hydroxy-phenyl)propionate hydroxylase